MKTNTLFYLVFFAVAGTLFAGAILFDFGLRDGSIGVFAYNIHFEKSYLPIFRRGTPIIFIVVSEDGILLPDPDWIVPPKSSSPTRNIEISKGNTLVPTLISKIGVTHQKLIDKYFQKNPTKAIYIIALYKFRVVPSRWAETNPISKTDLIRIFKDNNRTFQRIRIEDIPPIAKATIENETRKVFIEEN